MGIQSSRTLPSAGVEHPASRIRATSRQLRRAVLVLAMLAAGLEDR